MKRRDFLTTTTAAGAGALLGAGKPAAASAGAGARSLCGSRRCVSPARGGRCAAFWEGPCSLFLTELRFGFALGSCLECRFGL